MQHLKRLGSLLPVLARQRNLFNVKTSFVKNENFRFYSSIYSIESTEEFDEKVMTSDIPVLVDFHADWCGPCKAQGPRLEARVNSFEGQIQLAKINVDEVGSLADEFEIRAVPTILAVKNGEVIARFEGAMEDTEIDQMIEDTIAH